jgi:hypothetical protein
MARRIVLLVAFALLIPSLAMAGNISFSTTGTFSNPSLLPMNLLPITFTPTSITAFVGGNLAFGVFDVSACPVAKCSGSETFTLQISQTSPTSGTEDLVGTISGEVFHNGVTDLKLTFTTATVIIGATSYTIPFAQSINFSFTTLNGQVGPTAIPEPSAEFLLGMGALGLVGLATVSRKIIV